MEIKIDEQQVQEILNKQSSEAIKGAFEGYGVRSVIEKALIESAIPAVLGQAVEQAASKIDIAILSQHLAEEFAKSIIKGTQEILRSTMVEIILDIWKIPDYDREKRDRARQELKALLF